MGRKHYGVLAFNEYLLANKLRLAMNFAYSVDNGKGISLLFSKFPSYEHTQPMEDAFSNVANEIKDLLINPREIPPLQDEGFDVVSWAKERRPATWAWFNLLLLIATESLINSNGNLDRRLTALYELINLDSPQSLEQLETMYPKKTNQQKLLAKDLIAIFINHMALSFQKNNNEVSWNPEEIKLFSKLLQRFNESLKEPLDATACNQLRRGLEVAISHQNFKYPELKKIIRMHLSESNPKGGGKMLSTRSSLYLDANSFNQFLLKHESKLKSNFELTREKTGLSRLFKDFKDSQESFDIYDGVLPLIATIDDIKLEVIRIADNPDWDLSEEGFDILRWVKEASPLLWAWLNLAGLIATQNLFDSQAAVLSPLLRELVGFGSEKGFDEILVKSSEHSNLKDAVNTFKNELIQSFIVELGVAPLNTSLHEMPHNMEDLHRDYYWVFSKISNTFLQSLLTLNSSRDYNNFYRNLSEVILQENFNYPEFKDAMLKYQSKVSYMNELPRFTNLVTSSKDAFYSSILSALPKRNEINNVEQEDLAVYLSLLKDLLNHNYSNKQRATHLFEQIKDYKNKFASLATVVYQIIARLDPSKKDTSDFKFYKSRAELVSTVCNCEKDINADQLDKLTARYGLAMVPHLNAMRGRPSVKDEDLINCMDRAAELIREPHVTKIDKLPPLLESAKIVAPLPGGKIVAGIVLGLAGLTILGASAGLAFVSFGLLSPVSFLGATIGASLVVGGIAVALSSVSLAAIATSGLSLFKFTEKAPVRKDIEELAQKIQKPNS